MRIRLTEAQRDMLRRLNEAEVDLSDYFNKIKKLSKEVDSLYSKATFSTIAEFLENDTDATVLLDRLNEIDKIRHKLYMDAYNMIDKIPDDEYDSAGYDYDMQIDDADSKLSDKINSVEIILEFMDDMQTKNEDLGLSRRFADIQKVQINPE